MLDYIQQKLSNSSLRRQLVWVFFIAFTLFFLISAIATISLVTKTINYDYLQQGQAITKGYAENSKLALLYSSKENAKDATAATLAFRHIKQLAIYEVNQNEPLWQEGNIFNWVQTDELPLNTPLLEYEDNKFWQFKMAVISNEESLSPFDMEESTQEIFGYVRVLMSKDEVNVISNSIILASTITFLLLSATLFFILTLISNRVTKPLETIMNTMLKAEKGESTEVIPGSVATTKEFRKVANTFNKMIIVLRKREEEAKIARDEALETSRLKSEFAANISHEIRTPMNGILGTLNLLVDTPLNNEQNEYVEMAQASTISLISLINDILDFSKLQAKQLELESIKINIQELLEDIIVMHSRSVQAENLEMACFIDENVPLIFNADPSKLHQLFNNLIGNAVKFTDEGHIICKISRLSEQDDEIKLRFTISDTGIGIDPKDRKRIFKAYSQRDGSMSRKYGGTGLGLAICEQLVDLLGGSIDFDSEPNKGSEFHVELPFKKPKSSTSTTNQKTPIWENKRTLLISPPGIYHQTLSYFCHRHKLNYDWTPEINSIECLLERASIDKQAFDLIMINWPSNPEIVLKEVQRLKERFKNTPLKVIQFIRQTIEDSAHENNIADSFISRPIRAITAENTLRQLLSTESQESKKVSQNTSDFSAFADRNILLVEDNNVNQKVALATLKKLGLAADLAINGEEAVKATQEKEYHIILMDCQMPIMDGFVATKKIREMEKSKKLHSAILAMTANVAESDKQKCYECGMDDFLAKPFHRKDLANIISKWIDSQNIDNNDR